MTKFSIVFAAIALLGATAAAALQGPLFYECDITQRDKRVGWLSPKVGVIVTKNGQVLVTDSVTMHYYNKPVPARIRSRGQKLLVDWSLSGIKDNLEQNIPKFNFRIAINTSTNTAILTANPTDTPQKWTGRGSCVSRKK